MTEQTPSRCVITRDIKAAVSGRETDVLDGLGIDWRRCTHSNHIRCPYPEHGSDGDNWRWDARKAKAFCSCQTGHADGVLDVVMKCEGIDLESAKLRVAEMIGRSDLIKTRGGKGGERMDAVSLMNPPADMIDAGLPQAYLAHRLGIASVEVLMPTTACVGWRDLAYWDPPSKQGGKPIEVGQFPAVAFATIAADGGMHEAAQCLTLDGAKSCRAELAVPAYKLRGTRTAKRRSATTCENSPQPEDLAFGGFI